MEAPSTRTKLLEAARDTIRAKGYASTSVDDICAAAGVSKGSFFHHFASKEAMGVAAIQYWNETTTRLFLSQPYMGDDDPRMRVFGYLDLRLALISESIPGFTCLIGTTVQETYATSAPLRAASEAGLFDHVAMLARELDAARARHAPGADWTGAGIGAFIQASLQGAFILAKAKSDPQVARDCIAHLRRFIESLIGSAPRPDTRSDGRAGENDPSRENRP